MSDGGAEPITNQSELFERASLLVPELGMAAENEEFGRRVQSVFTPAELDGWLGCANSPAALDCIKRFSAIEGDVNSSAAKGLGRVTAASFPRLGGSLCKIAQKAHVDSPPIVAGVEQTLHAWLSSCARWHPAGGARSCDHRFRTALASLDSEGIHERGRRRCGHRRWHRRVR